MRTQCSQKRKKQQQPQNVQLYVMKELKKKQTVWQNQVLKRMQRNWDPHILPVARYNGTCSWKKGMLVSCKVKHMLPTWPSNPREMKTFLHMKACTWMFTAVLLIILENWKRFKCPSVSEWLNKAWYIQTMEYYSTIKRHDIETRNNLDGSQTFMLRERN